MAFLRSVLTTTKTTVAIAAIPTAAFVFSLSSSQFPNKSQPSNFTGLISSTFPINKLSLVRNLSNSPPSAVLMDAHVSDQKNPPQNDTVFPELLTEFMVDMTCEGCVKSVKNKLQTVEGVKNVEVDLSNLVVRVLGSSPVKLMTEALEQTGKKARLIGQGIPEDFLISATVSEFKGPVIYGVVRLAQVNMELARIEANFSGLKPGKHGWSINEFGDLTKGAASTGKIFNKPIGDLGTLEVDEKGEVYFSGVKEKLRVGDLIGRAIVVYESEDKSDSGLIAAVIARSAGVGENYKKLCTCDGTTIWEANSNL